jgi:hypothetical protein
MDQWCAIAAYAVRLPVSPSRGPRSQTKIADFVEYVQKERKVTCERCVMIGERHAPRHTVFHNAQVGKARIRLEDTVN